jgi:hypothetical protein
VERNYIYSINYQGVWEKGILAFSRYKLRKNKDNFDLRGKNFKLRKIAGIADFLPLRLRIFLLKI